MSLSGWLQAKSGIECRQLDSCSVEECSVQDVLNLRVRRRCFCFLLVPNGCFRPGWDHDTMNMVEREDMQSSVFGRPPLLQKCGLNFLLLQDCSVRSRLPCLTERPHLCGETCSLQLQTCRRYFCQPTLRLQLLNV